MSKSYVTVSRDHGPIDLPKFNEMRDAATKISQFIIEQCKPQHIRNGAPIYFGATALDDIVGGTLILMQVNTFGNPEVTTTAQHTDCKDRVAECIEYLRQHPEHRLSSYGRNETQKPERVGRWGGAVQTNNRKIVVRGLREKYSEAAALFIAVYIGDITLNEAIELVHPPNFSKRFHNDHFEKIWHLYWKNQLEFTA